MEGHTAVSAYGFQAYTPAYPGGASVLPSTESGDGNIPSGVLPRMSFGHQNPLFWVLIILLVVTGYLTFGFDIGLKKVGALKLGT